MHPGHGDYPYDGKEMGAYTLVDSAPVAFEDKVNLKIVLQGDPVLFNPTA
jgi:ABC-type tungstate transport system permease subunit